MHLFIHPYHLIGFKALLLLTIPDEMYSANGFLKICSQSTVSLSDILLTDEAGFT
jgi:hypothetical protein